MLSVTALLPIICYICLYRIQRNVGAIAGGDATVGKTVSWIADKIISKFMKRQQPISRNSRKIASYRVVVKKLAEIHVISHLPLCLCVGPQWAIRIWDKKRKRILVGTKFSSKLYRFQNLVFCLSGHSKNKRATDN